MGGTVAQAYGASSDLVRMPGLARWRGYGADGDRGGASGWARPGAVVRVVACSFKQGRDLGEDLVDDVLRRLLRETPAARLHVERARLAADHHPLRVQARPHQRHGEP